MTRNEGNTDRIIRFIVGALLLLAWLLGWISGTLAIVLGLVGAILVITSFIGFCPLYTLFGLKTTGAKRT